MPSQLQLEDLRGELREYETLRKRGVEAVEVTSFEELPESLVKARLAAGLTQKELEKGSESKSSRFRHTRRRVIHRRVWIVLNEL